MASTADSGFVPLNIAILTISDTRNEDTDKSGRTLVDRAESAGHKVVAKAIVKDDVWQMRTQVCQWIGSDDVQVIISTGGTGFSGRDSTPEALAPLFDKPIEGFGELFRQLSYGEIGTSTIQSRAVAGFANGTLVFCLPGSTSACRTGWDKVIAEQLDATHKPCNFVVHLKKPGEAAS